MYALMSDFKMLCCHVSLIPWLELASFPVPRRRLQYGKAGLPALLYCKRRKAGHGTGNEARLEPETTGHVNKAKLQQSLLMDVDLPLGTEQALMLHSVYIIPCILLS